MAMRVYALYQNSRLILWLIMAVWLAAIAVGCVRVFPQYTTG